jgi:hypothetical protein
MRRAFAFEVCEQLENGVDPREFDFWKIMSSFRFYSSNKPGQSRLAGIGTVAHRHGCQGFTEPVLSTLLYKIILVKRIDWRKDMDKNHAAPAHPLPQPQKAACRYQKNDDAKIIKIR